MEIPGGRKFILALIIVVALLAIMLIMAIRQTLAEGITLSFGGIITTIVGWFFRSNTENNKAALAAGKARDEETTLLDTLSDSDVLARAGGRSGSDVAGAVERVADGAAGAMRGRADALGAELSGEAEVARGRLRGAATAGGGGSGGYCIPPTAGGERWPTG